MLGWEIQIINQATNQKYADWLTGLDGTKWVEKLFEEGKAEKFYEVACSHYLIKAIDLKAIILGNNGFILKADKAGAWIDEVVIDVVALKECNGEEILRIQTYDVS